MDSEWIVPKWAFVAALAAFVVVGGAVFWATTAERDHSSSLNIAPKPDLGTSEEAVGPKVRLAVVPPSRNIAPIPETLPSLTSARETVNAPSFPDTSKPKVTKQLHRRVGSNVTSGMFPFGSVRRESINHQHPKNRTFIEQFPSFEYACKQWSYTGKLASSSGIEMSSVGFRLGNREVFKLAGSESPPEVMFVQSATKPGKYAIYRKN